MRLSFLSVFLLFVLSQNANALRVVEQQVILDKLEDYEMCQGRDYTGEFCHDALVRWVEKNPTDAFSAGKMTRKKMNAWGAIPFFTKAFNDGKGNCKDEDVKLAIISAFKLPPDGKKNVIDEAKKIGIETCFEDMKTDLVEAASIGSYTFQNICKELLSKGLLTGLKAKKCKEIK